VEDRGAAAYAAEFLGTLILVSFVCLVLSVYNASGGIGYTDFAVIGLLHLLVLMTLIYTLGGASGAHFNPAITTALAAVRKIAPIDAGIYILLQLAGGIAGALICKVLLLDEGKAINYGAAGVSQQFLDGKTMAGALGELIGTFMLVWAVMGAAVNPRAVREWAGLIIGGTLAFSVMVFGPLTGGSFNPARAFGPALVGKSFDGAGKFLVVYVAAALVGALMAAFGYKAIVLDPQERAPGERPIDKLD
jgi:glycerol uptake facilitator protein